MDMPVHATACQLCDGTPGTKVAAVSCTVGTFQLMSPKSVEAGMTSPISSGCTDACADIGVDAPGTVARILSANACSSEVYSKPPTFSRMPCCTLASVSFGSTFQYDVITSCSTVVPVPSAAPFDASTIRSQ